MVAVTTCQPTLCLSAHEAIPWDAFFPTAYLNITDGELGTLGKELAIHCDERGAIIVRASPVTTLLVCVQVSATTLGCSTHDQVGPLAQLPQLVVGPRAIRKDLNAVQAELNVWRPRRENFLTRF